jgi:hypothetical protein
MRLIGLHRLRRARTVIAAPLFAAIALLAGCKGSDSTTPITQMPTMSIALSATTVAATPSTPGTISVIVTRGGGYTGDVTLSAEGLPTGVTALFNPSVVTSTGSASVLTLKAGTNATGGTTTITLRGTGTGGVTASTGTLALTVTATQGFSVALVPASLSVVQGNTGTVTVNIARTGGFAGTVNFAVTGLPAAVTPTVTPAGATGNSATIGLAVGASVPVGPYTGTITATATGAATSVTTFTLTVSASGGGGGNIAWAFCDPTRIPLYFAVRDGASGTWTQLTAGANNTYSFTLTNGIGSVAYVIKIRASITTTIQMLTASEVAAAATAECVSHPATSTVFGSIAGLGTTESAQITLGTAVGSASFAAPGFTLNNGPSGSRDLIATRFAPLDPEIYSDGQAPNMMMIRRGLNQADGSSIPVIDFNGAEAFVPATAIVTFANLGFDYDINYQLTTGFFITANGSTASVFDAKTGSGGTFYGVPSANLIASDLQGLQATVMNLNHTSSRSVAAYFHALANKTLPFGAALTTPTVTSSVSGTVLLPRLQGTLQTEYDTGVGASFSQSATNHSVTVLASKGYIGAGTAYGLEVPDLVPSGYLGSWGLIAGAATPYTLFATGASTGAPTNAIVDGTTFQSAATTGSVPSAAIRR